MTIRFLISELGFRIKKSFSISKNKSEIEHSKSEFLNVSQTIQELRRVYRVSASLAGYV